MILAATKLIHEERLAKELSEKQKTVEEKVEEKVEEVVVKKPTRSRKKKVVDNNE